MHRLENRLHWLAVCLVAVMLLGCGHEKYEERLAATAAFYTYLEKIDASLAPAWTRSDFGISMRVPRPFSSPLRGPEVVKGEDGNDYITPDPRHPYVLGIELPGIVDAWQASLTTDDSQPAEARFYVLSNQEYFLADDGPSPAEFLTNLDLLLQSAFNVTIPDGEATQPGDNVFYRHSAPVFGSPDAKYTPVKNYNVIRFVPDGPVGGQDLQALVYQHSAGDVQAAIVVLCPKNITSQFRQNIDLSLQTLSVTSTPLSTRSTGAGRGGGTGASGAGANF